VAQDSFYEEDPQLTLKTFKHHQLTLQAFISDIPLNALQWIILHLLLQTHSK